MKTLNRHSLYLAIFLGLLLFVAGLTLFQEIPVLEVAGGVTAMIIALSLVVWALLRLVLLPKVPPIADEVYAEKEPSFTT